MTYRNRKHFAHWRNKQVIQRQYDEPATPFWLWLSGQLGAHKLSESRFTRQFSQYRGVYPDRHQVQSWREGSIPTAKTCTDLAGFFGVPACLVFSVAGHAYLAEHEVRDGELAEVPLTIQADLIRYLTERIPDEDTR